MFIHQGLKALALSIVLGCSVACVTTGTHEAALKAEAEKQAALEGKLGETQTELSETREKLSGDVTELETKLSTAISQNDQLIKKLKSMGSNVEKLLGEKDSLASQRQKLESEIQSLRRMRELSEARNAEYKGLLVKLRGMIDAGSLEVKFRNGRMLVAMSSDVLFPPGKAKLKKAAKKALEDLAQTLIEFPDRKFQVVGHSDSSPISQKLLKRFPSNWELSSQRAIEVVKLLVEAGVDPNMLTAAGASSYDPLTTVPLSDETPEDRKINRRVELVFVPRLDQLPGFDEILKEE